MKLTRCGPIIALFLLTACGPSETQKAQWADQKRIECLDKLCPGDVEPKRDHLQESISKICGQWFIAPKEYGDPSHLAFLWPSKSPARGGSGSAPEFVPSSAGVSSNFYEVGIEIFLRSQTSPPHGSKRYQALLDAEAEGRATSKNLLRPGLEVWHTRETDGLGPGLCYVATLYTATDPNGAVLSCRSTDPKFGRCVTAFEWKPGITADMRFRAKHAADWPEIYLEAIRVLRLLGTADAIAVDFGGRGNDALPCLAGLGESIRSAGNDSTWRMAA